MNTLARAGKCLWICLVRGVFCCLKVTGRGPLSAALLSLYAACFLKKTLWKEISVFQAIAHFCQCFLGSS